MSNRTASSFGATDQRVYVTNNRVAVFDYNTEQIRLDLSSGNVKVGITGPVSLAPGALVGLTGAYVYGGYIGVTGSFQSGAIEISANQYVGITGPVGVTGSISVTNFPSVIGITGGITGSVSVNNFPTQFSVSGPVTISGGITGSVSVNNFPTQFSVSGPVTISGGITGSISVTNFPSVIGITGGITGSVSVNNFPTQFSVSGPVGITGIVQTHDASANALLTTIETDISGGILVKGQDDTGTRYPLYVDANGVQRTQVVTGHIENAKYVFSTDVALITSSIGLGWSIDTRGRKGWYYSGAGTSDLNWYANTISAPPALAFNKAQAVWMVLTVDQTANLPIFTVGTAASTWQYSVTFPNQVVNGETYVFYHGIKAINLNPNYHPIEMTRTLVYGPGTVTQTITDIRILNNACTGYLAISAGVWNQDIQQQFAVIFNDNNDYQEQQKILSLNVDTEGTLKTGVYGTIPGLAPAVRANMATQSLSQYTTSTRTALATDSLTRGQAVSDTPDIPWNATYPGMYTVTAERTSSNANGITGQYRVGLTTLVDNPVTYPVNTRVVNGSYVGITGGITGSVSVNNFPATQTVSGTVGLTTGTIVGITGSIGSVTIPNGTLIGITGGVTGDVWVQNFPTTQGITGAISILPNQTVGVTGTVSVSNFPTTQGITGAISILPNQTVGVTGPQTVNNYGDSGLNVYTIYPKKISYIWSGYNNNNVTSSLILGYGGTLTINAYNYGTTPKKFWMSSGTAGKVVKYDYVDASFNLVRDASMTLSTTALPIANNTEIMAVLKTRLVDATGVNTMLYYDISGASYQIGGSTDRNNFNGLFTCPDGYIGKISLFYFYANATQTFNLMKCNSVDVGKNCLYQGSGFSNSNLITTDGLGGILQPRDTLFVLRSSPATDCNFYATVILEAV